MLVHVAHALTLDKVIEYKEVSFSAPSVPAEMNGYRLAFVSDTHSMPQERLKELVDELNNRSVDLLVLGGDYSNRVDVSHETMELLSQVATTDGIYGVDGNHDRFQALFAAMEEFSIRPLSNDGLTVREGFYLAGVADLWNRQASIASAIGGAAPDDFVLLVSHNPDISMLQDTSGVDLVLSGHTHGGQMTLFSVWAPLFTFTKPVNNSITKFGQRFRSGWALSNDDTPVLVSNGAGEYSPRVFARPQAIMLTLYHED